MKRKSLVLLSVLCAILLVSMLALSACNEKTCSHSYSVEWQKDETNHWHVCTLCGEAGEKTAHTYDQEVVSEDYLVEGATCGSPATYYKSCVCGAKGTETFTNGEALNHAYPAPGATSGIVWEWNADKTTATLKLSCTHSGCTHVESITATVGTPVQKDAEECPCLGAVEGTVTATATFGGQTYTDTKDVTIAQTAHNLVSVKRDATCTVAGIKEGTYDCSYCGSRFFLDDTNGTVIVGDHKYVQDPTKETYETAILAHTWTLAHEAVAKTCTTDGVKACYKCSACEQLASLDGDVYTVIEETYDEWKIGAGKIAKSHEYSDDSMFVCTICQESRTLTAGEAVTILNNYVGDYTITFKMHTSRDEIAKVESGASGWTAYCNATGWNCLQILYSAANVDEAIKATPVWGSYGNPGRLIDRTGGSEAYFNDSEFDTEVKIVRNGSYLYMEFLNDGSADAIDHYYHYLLDVSLASNVKFLANNSNVTITDYQFVATADTSIELITTHVVVESSGEDSKDTNRDKVVELPESGIASWELSNLKVGEKLVLNFTNQRTSSSDNNNWWNYFVYLYNGDVSEHLTTTNMLGRFRQNGSDYWKNGTYTHNSYYAFWNGQTGGDVNNAAMLNANVTIEIIRVSEQYITLSASNKAEGYEGHWAVAFDLNALCSDGVNKLGVALTTRSANITLTSAKLYAHTVHDYVYTDTEGATHTATCSICGKVVTENHTLVAKCDLTNHWDECSVCGAILNLEAHTFVEGVCSKCGTIECTHNWAVVEGKEADCLNDGYLSCYHCITVSGCGVYATYDAENDKYVVIKDYEAWKVGEGKIEALGHDYTGANPFVCARCECQRIIDKAQTVSLFSNLQGDFVLHISFKDVVRKANKAAYGDAVWDDIQIKANVPDASSYIIAMPSWGSYMQGGYRIVQGQLGETNYMANYTTAPYDLDVTLTRTGNLWKFDWTIKYSEDVVFTTTQTVILATTCYDLTVYFPGTASVTNYDITWDTNVIEVSSDGEIWKYDNVQTQDLVEANYNGKGNAGYEFANLQVGETLELNFHNSRIASGDNNWQNFMLYIFNADVNEHLIGGSGSATNALVRYRGNSIDLWKKGVYAHNGIGKGVKGTTAGEGYDNKMANADVSVFITRLTADEVYVAAYINSPSGKAVVGSLAIKLTDLVDGGVDKLGIALCSRGADITMQSVKLYGHTNHNYVASYDAESHYEICACGEKKNVVAHNFVDEVVAPTYEADGYTRHTCACGYTYTDTVVAKLVHGTISSNNSEVKFVLNTPVEFLVTTVPNDDLNRLVRIRFILSDEDSAKLVNFECYENDTWNTFTGVYGPTEGYQFDARTIKFRITLSDGELNYTIQVATASDGEVLCSESGKIDTCNHTWTLVEGKAADCENDGYLPCYHCTTEGGCGVYALYNAETDKYVVIEDYEAWKVGEGKLAKLGHDYTGANPFVCQTCQECRTLSIGEAVTVLNNYVGDYTITFKMHTSRTEIAKVEAGASGWTAYCGATGDNALQIRYSAGGVATAIKATAIWGSYGKPGRLVDRTGGNTAYFNDGEFDTEVKIVRNGSYVYMEFLNDGSADAIDHYYHYLLDTSYASNVTFLANNSNVTITDYQFVATADDSIELITTPVVVESSGESAVDDASYVNRTKVMELPASGIASWELSNLQVGEKLVITFTNSRTTSTGNNNWWNYFVYLYNGDESTHLTTTNMLIRDRQNGADSWKNGVYQHGAGTINDGWFNQEGSTANNNAMLNANVTIEIVRASERYVTISTTNTATGYVGVWDVAYDLSALHTGGVDKLGVALTTRSANITLTSAKLYGHTTHAYTTVSDATTTYDICTCGAKKNVVVNTLTDGALSDGESVQVLEDYTGDYEITFTMRTIREAIAKVASGADGWTAYCTATGNNALQVIYSANGQANAINATAIWGGYNNPGRLIDRTGGAAAYFNDSDFTTDVKIVRQGSYVYMEFINHGSEDAINHYYKYMLDVSLASNLKFYAYNSDVTITNYSFKKFVDSCGELIDAPVVIESSGEGADDGKTDRSKLNELPASGIASFELSDLNVGETLTLNFTNCRTLSSGNNNWWNYFLYLYDGDASEHLTTTNMLARSRQNGEDSWKNGTYQHASGNMANYFNQAGGGPNNTAMLNADVTIEIQRISEKYVIVSMCNKGEGYEGHWAVCYDLTALHTGGVDNLGVALCTRSAEITLTSAVLSTSVEEQ